MGLPQQRLVEPFEHGETLLSVLQPCHRCACQGKHRWIPHGVDRCGNLAHNLPRSIMQWPRSFEVQREALHWCLHHCQVPVQMNLGHHLGDTKRQAGAGQGIQQRRLPLGSFIEVPEDIMFGQQADVTTCQIFGIGIKLHPSAVRPTVEAVSQTPDAADLCTPRRRCVGIERSLEQCQGPALAPPFMPTLSHILRT